MDTSVSESGPSPAHPDPIPAPATSTSTSEQPQALSKNAQKKLLKAARIAEQKKERRAAEKERRKEKKRELAAKRAAGELDDADDERERKRARTEAQGPKKPFQARIVVDLAFDDKMTENEIKSLTSQLAYTYSANRKASHPFAALLFTSLDGRTYTRMEGMSNAAYKRWHGAEWWSESYEALWKPQDEKDGDEPMSDRSKKTSDNPQTEVPTEAQSNAVPSEAASVIKLLMKPQRAPQNSVVYLTADSSDELSELKEGETYIIGGICDHNRYKNLCFNKSKTSGIRSARLPIGTYLAELRTRKVLTVNQTFEILLKWTETRDWRQAFEEVVPKRKFRDPEEGNKGKESDGQGKTVVVYAAALEDGENGEAEDNEESDDAAEGPEDNHPSMPADTNPATVPPDDMRPEGSTTST